MPAEQTMRGLQRTNNTSRLWRERPLLGGAGAVVLWGVYGYINCQTKDPDIGARGRGHTSGGGHAKKVEQLVPTIEEPRPELDDSSVRPCGEASTLSSGGVSMSVHSAETSRTKRVQRPSTPAKTAALAARRGGPIQFLRDFGNTRPAADRRQPEKQRSKWRCAPGRSPGHHGLRARPLSSPAARAIVPVYTDRSPPAPAAARDLWAALSRRNFAHDLSPLQGGPGFRGSICVDAEMRHHGCGARSLSASGSKRRLSPRCVAAGGDP